ncbi:MAG TPA: uroporphyrinogen-III C-methyltransferase [Paenalcaligenes hominis]|uniref:Uroporphyrinogen-III C-methyltransferase n=1 Tax=Paenalcaligenes hominis TaxID=643674 RepID=A0A9D2VGW7_9BURK|nr:uroporphyrinogen-III C-methyltransferase [Paenalcaligenes hominis]
MKEKSDNTNQTQQATGATASPASTPAKTKTKSAKGPVLLTALVALALGGGAVWYIQNNQQHLSQHYDSQLQLLVQQVGKNEQSAKQALTQVENQAQQLQRINNQLAQALEQLKDVSTAVQTISDSGTEIMLLNDIEQLAALAQQQLQVGGSVANAIVTLETAQARLTQANRQNFAVLIQTINGDLDRLRTAQVIDVPTLTAQLERLTELINQAPLYITEAGTVSPEPNGSATAADETAAATPSVADDSAWWQRVLSTAADLTQQSWNSIRQDLGQFVSVRRVDDNAALLISPEQADRLRENLRLRITMAQLALMTKQPKVWQSEMAFIVKALEDRFDASKALTQRALALATQLADTDVDLKLPTIDNTLAVIESLKQGSEDDFEPEPTSELPQDTDRGSEPAPIEPDTHNEAAPDSQSTETEPASSSEPGDSAKVNLTRIQQAV